MEVHTQRVEWEGGVDVILVEEGAGEELHEEDEGEDVEHRHRRRRKPAGERIRRQPAPIVDCIFLFSWGFINHSRLWAFVLLRESGQLGGRTTSVCLLARRLDGSLQLVVLYRKNRSLNVRPGGNLLNTYINL